MWWEGGELEVKVRIEIEQRTIFKCIGGMQVSGKEALFTRKHREMREKLIECREGMVIMILLELWFGYFQTTVQFLEKLQSLLLHLMFCWSLFLVKPQDLLQSRIMNDSCLGAHSYRSHFTSSIKFTESSERKQKGDLTAILA